MAISFAIRRSDHAPGRDCRTGGSCTVARGFVLLSPEEALGNAGLEGGAVAGCVGVVEAEGFPAPAGVTVVAEFGCRAAAGHGDAGGFKAAWRPLHRPAHSLRAALVGPSSSEAGRRLIGAHDAFPPLVRSSTAERPPQRRLRRRYAMALRVTATPSTAKSPQRDRAKNSAVSSATAPSYSV